VQVAEHHAALTAVSVVRLAVVVRFQSPETLPLRQAQPFIAALGQAELAQLLQIQAERLVATLGSTLSMQLQHPAQMPSLQKVAALEQTLVSVDQAVQPRLDLDHLHIQAVLAEQ
jgi:hypothetical protein